MVSKDCESGKWSFASTTSTGRLNLDICFVPFINREFSKGQSPSVFIESKQSAAGQSSKILHAFFTAWTRVYEGAR